MGCRIWLRISVANAMNTPQWSNCWFQHIYGCAVTMGGYAEEVEGLDGGRFYGWAQIACGWMAA